MFKNISLWINSNKFIFYSTIFLLLIIVVISITPLLIANQIEKFLLENGGEEVVVENVDFNPFFSEFVLEGVSIKRADEIPLNLERIIIKLNSIGLFSKKLILENIELSGLDITIKQLQSKDSHVGGLLLNNFVADENNIEVVDPDTNEKWNVIILSASFKELNISYANEKINSNLKINSLSVSDYDNQIVDQQTKIDFDVLIDNAAAQFNGYFSFSENIKNINGKLYLEKLKLSDYLVLISPELKGNKFLLNATTTIDVGFVNDSLSIDQNGSVSLEEVLWSQNQMLIKAEKMSWQGASDIVSSPTQEMKINLNGKLNANQVYFDNTKIEQIINNDELIWQGKLDIDVASNQDKTIVLNGQFQNKEFQIDDNLQAFVLKNGYLNWLGKAKFVSSNEGSWNLDTQSRLQNETLTFEDIPDHLQVMNKGFAWEGDLNLSKHDDVLSSASNSYLKVLDTDLKTLDANELLIGFEEFNLEDIQLTSIDSISIKELNTRKLAIGKPRRIEEVDINTNGFMTIEKLNINHFDFSQDKGVLIDAIFTQGLDINLWKDPQGKWVFMSLIDSFKSHSSKKDEDSVVTASTEKKLPIKIGKFINSKPSQLLLVDQSLSETLVQKLSIESLQLLKISSKIDAPASDFEMSMRLDEKSKFSIDGKLAPFSEQPEFDLKVNIEALSLVPYNLLMKQHMGYEIDSGSLNAEAGLLAKEGVLESEFDVVMHQLDLVQLSEDELKKIGGTLNAGLESGLSMLKDKNDTIKLKIPVNGKFDDLKINPNDIINQALGSALKSGAKTYLAAALFPFGTLLVVADAINDQAMKVKLDPIFFTPGSSELDKKYPPYLNKVVAVLGEKPEIFVKICGVSTNSDREFFVDAMQKKFAANESENDGGAEKDKKQFSIDETMLKGQLEKLAVKRTDVVEKYLLGYKKTLVKRLISCQSRVALDKTKPRTDLLF